MQASTRTPSWWRIPGEPKTEQHSSSPRRGLNIAEDVTRPVKLMVHEHVAHVSNATTRQLKTLFEFILKKLFPPAPTGETLLAMPAEVNFASFVATLGNPRK